MPDIQRFAIFTLAAFALFFALVSWVTRKRVPKPRKWSMVTLATVVVPLGMTFARYSHIFIPDLPGPIYYGIPALITFVLPPIWLRMSRWEIARYVPLAVFIAPTIHVLFSFFIGWHDYMPFPVYIRSVAELVRHTGQ
jgi:hypothetical protein